MFTVELGPTILQITTSSDQNTRKEESETEFVLAKQKKLIYDLKEAVTIRSVIAHSCTIVNYTAVCTEGCDIQVGFVLHQQQPDGPVTLIWNWSKIYDDSKLTLEKAH